MAASIYFRHVTIVGTCSIAAVVGLFVITVSRGQRCLYQAAKNAAPKDEQRRNNRAFGIINAVTYAAVFMLFLVLPELVSRTLCSPDVAIVELHFFALPSLYQHRANLLSGMVIWAVACVFLFKADGNRMAAFVTHGAGIALWVSAAGALNTATQLKIREPLMSRWVYPRTRGHHQYTSVI
jgi:hypothetical protein